MHLKDILVHIDDRPTCSSRLDAAVQLARQQKAQLTGIYIVPPPHLYDAPRESDLVDKAEKLFRQRAAAADLENDWIRVDNPGKQLDVGSLLNIHAHYHDLLVISQTDESTPDRFIPDNLPEKAVLGSGRPVLVVPYVGQFDHHYRCIMLAWRGGPESARALHDAMPVLRSAEQIKIISIFDQGEPDYQHPGMDISNHMVRHQLPLSREKHSGGDLRVGDMLLNRCADIGANLLVMGATSQTRRGVQTLGETGRYMLKSMTIPVLMSH